MAISAATVFEVRGTVLNGSPGPGADTNGGGFVAGSGGTDFSMQNAAQVAVGGGTVTSTITAAVVTFTGGTYTVLAGDVGNIVQFISGTNVTAGFYQIASVGAGLNGTWTLDRTPLTSGTTTNAVANMGGALGGSAVNSGLAKLAGAMIASNKAYLTGAFTQTATPTFAQTVTPTTTAQNTRLIGYGVTRGDGVHATITLSTNTGLSGIAATGNGFAVENIDVNCASLGTSTGINITGTQFCDVRHCKVSNFTSIGIVVQSQSGVEDCEVTGGVAPATFGISGVAPVSAIRCFVHDNACSGISVSSGSTIIDSIISNNSGASSDGIQTSWGCRVLNNTLHNNGRHGISLQTTNLMQLYQLLNNIISNNGGFGLVSNNAIPASPSHDGNAFFSNTSGSRSLVDDVSGINSVTPYTNTRDVTLSASPYVGPTTGTTANFALNNTAGAGAACRKAGSPSTWPGNTGTTGFLDMGAVQTASGGGVGIIVPV